MSIGVTESASSGEASTGDIDFYVKEQGDSQFRGARSGESDFYGREQGDSQYRGARSGESDFYVREQGDSQYRGSQYRGYCFLHHGARRQPVQGCQIRGK